MAKTIKPEASSLVNIKQKTDETLKQYLARFNIEAARARGVDDSSHLMAIRAGILPASAFWEDLQRKLIYTLAEFNRRAQRAMNLEEAELLLINPDVASASSSKNPGPSSGYQSQKGSKRKNKNFQGMGIKRRKGITSMFPYTMYIPSSMSLGNESMWPMRRPYHLEEPTL